MTVHSFQINRQNAKALSFPDVSSLDAITRQLPSGLYTTFRTFENGTRVVGLRRHFRRLYEPARRMGLAPEVTEERLRAVLAGVLADLPYEARVRPILTFAGEMYILFEPFLPLPPEVYSQGVRVITVELHRSHPALKKTAFIEMSQEIRRRLSERSAFEALMVYHGRILEGLTTNFFYIRAGCLGTARRGVLPGVTRRAVLHLARRGGGDVRYRPLALTDIPQLSEAFLTSSSRGIVPVVQIDASRVGDGNVGNRTRQLMEAYESYVRQHAEPILPGRRQIQRCSKIS